ncbi:hypothetical protein GE061_007641 [Apolygus lucorum]|uniref:Uncharacterized protein n=1 Tax=Apolygus lucorum TaxID=248454 RepID=A0A6A4J1W8_APOLU|nr:hypothetical protein GE061_007641 [Apolygus lucorum]
MALMFVCTALAFLARLHTTEAFSCYACNSIENNSCKDITWMSVSARTKHTMECSIIEPGFDYGCLLLATIRGSRFKYREVMRSCSVVFSNTSTQHPCQGYRQIVSLAAHTRILTCEVCNKSLCNDQVPTDMMGGQQGRNPSLILFFAILINSSFP